jgi:hypothetical protein
MGGFEETLMANGNKVDTTFLALPGGNIQLQPNQLI